MQTAKKNGVLTEEQLCRFASVPGWTWGGKQGCSPAAQEAASSSSRAQPNFTPNPDCVHWTRITLQMMMMELARTEDKEGQRALLRKWQLKYHPDKNLENSEFVLPLYRWAQQ